MGGPEEGLKALGLTWGEPSALPQSQGLISPVKPQPMCGHSRASGPCHVKDRCAGPRAGPRKGKFSE